MFTFHKGTLPFPSTTWEGNLTSLHERIIFPSLFFLRNGFRNQMATENF